MHRSLAASANGQQQHNACMCVFDDRLQFASLNRASKLGAAYAISALKASALCVEGQCVLKQGK